MFLSRFGSLTRTSLLTGFSRLCYSFSSFMRRKGNISPWINTRLVRVIAVLFLLYTAVDLMNPQLCGEEFSGQVSAAAALPNDVSIESPALSFERSDLKSEQQVPPSAPHTDEDCFCCCAHVLPGLSNQPDGSSNLVSRVSINVVLQAASADLQALYHPPRFA